eukprot:4849007-Pyramimonas_sp.AAC.1
MHCTVLHCTAVIQSWGPKASPLIIQRTALYCTVLSCTVLHCVVLSCTVLHGTVAGAPPAGERPRGDVRRFQCLPSGASLHPA